VSLSRTPSITGEKIKYPKPIVDYSKQKKLALKMYNSVFH